MNIDPHSNANQLYSQQIAKQQNAAQAGKQDAPITPATTIKGSDKLQLNALDRVRSAPEIRPEVVAKGKELLQDPNFPSPEMINHIAKLIVPFADDE